jgi:hypothetical protein
MAHPSNWSSRSVKEGPGPVAAAAEVSLSDILPMVIKVFLEKENKIV